MEETKEMPVRQEKAEAADTMMLKGYVRVGEERDIRLAKRNIDSFDRFLLLFNKEYMSQLSTANLAHNND